MKKIAFIVSVLFIVTGCSLKNQPKPEKSNVLFICIDDLNDWTGCLGGHPDSQTPQLDRLAKRSVLFTAAYCPAPSCNPSRASILTGILPSGSGVYFNSQPWRKSPVLNDIQTLPQYFRANGYKAMGSGKTFHDRFPDPESWDEYWPSLSQQRPEDPVPQHRPVNGIPNTGHFDWGPVQVPKEEMGDWKVADWVIGQLNKKQEKPFFLACGFFRPHLPWYVPQEYFDKFPVDKIKLPVVNENDTNDIPGAGKRFIRFRDHENVLKYGQWEKAVQGYLASINFMDECLGRVIGALESSEYRDNTIVVLWSDHGWSLGEKQHWRKFALWENTTRTVFLMKDPGNTGEGRICDNPVNLTDIFPTLVELCGLPPKAGLDGSSLVPLLKDPLLNQERPVLTTHGRKNHALRTHDWRFIHYEDGSMELYDHRIDPEEWQNLALNPELGGKLDSLKKFLPESDAESIAEGVEN